ncbi:uncharacterized protein At1g26090, chloroplastic [Cryptomeria japonica]|uniref:uncharacterized protein At1g26090, chloroplastic n=1 Tax=Cryptomeria japonica TaxID=3369 RepID=UPI0025ABFB01|nr:uncharacterized protein At1g26090, chloroplastic [Cryptomeria japonica]
MGTPLNSSLSSTSHFKCSTWTPRRKIWRNGQMWTKTFKVRAEEQSTRLVTFVGKGGAGKTTCALMAAQYFARMGLRTCLVIQSQDPTAEFLLGHKIRNVPSPVGNDSLHAVRLESTKMLLEPLSRLKKADSRINLTQGALGEIVGEELGVLPGMDSILAIGALGQMIQFVGGSGSSTKEVERKYDVVVYDGISSEETMRMLGASERSRWYMRYLRNLAEKTDTGRLTAPSFLKLTVASLNQDSLVDSGGQTSAKIWDSADSILEKGSSAFANPLKFSCYLVMDPSNCMSVKAALRYWGCAIQAGAHVAGAFYPASALNEASNKASIEEKFCPLATAGVPLLSMDSAINWDIAMNNMDEDAKKLLTINNISSRSISPVTFDQNKKMLTLFMPGFDKSEIKLSQWRGGSELLVEAGDQRRIINLPIKMQGKVTGAKFDSGNLVITLK